MISFEFTTVRDIALCSCLTTLGAGTLELIENVLTLDHAPKDSMLAVKVMEWPTKAEEELRTIRVWA